MLQSIAITANSGKLCGENEVLAQVKLRFLATTGARMTATRNISLSVKRGVRAMKTLDANLVMRRDADKLSVSSRVAELDQMIPQYLGVSKAILDNVVFCHQDESLWPLSEPSVLKKKFDEIFEALKYTKAVENLKVLRKKRGEELGILTAIEDREKVNKNNADKAREDYVADDVWKLTPSRPSAVQYNCRRNWRLFNSNTMNSHRRSD